MALFIWLHYSPWIYAPKRNADTMKQGQLLRSFMETVLSVPLFFFLLYYTCRLKVCFNLPLLQLLLCAHTHTCTAIVLTLNSPQESTFIIRPSASNQTLALAKSRLLFLNGCGQHLLCAASTGQQDSASQSHFQDVETKLKRFFSFHIWSSNVFLFSWSSWYWC